MSALLSRLRAYAAANPTDVAVIAETVRQGAELDAYRELAQLSRRWRLRNDAAKRVARSECRATVHALMVRTLRGGMRAPVFEEEPFPLVRRLADHFRQKTVSAGTLVTTSSAGEMGQ